MSVKLYVLIVLIGFLAISCTPYVGKLLSIDIGMSKREVILTLGNPDFVKTETTTQGIYEVLVYKLSDYQGSISGLETSSAYYSFYFDKKGKLLSYGNDARGWKGSLYSESDVPSYWPSITKSESEIKTFFDSNIDNLDPIEGIWTVTHGGSWRNISSGMTGFLPKDISYRIAIFKDTTFMNYDFTAIILESNLKQWTPGRVKARFRKTAYIRAYEAIWYRANYTEKKSNYIIEESGIIKNTEIDYDQKNQYIELSLEMIFIKAYPSFVNKPSFSQDKGLKSTGSGFLISETGLIVTNWHVVNGNNSIEVYFPQIEKTFLAEIVLKDANNDVAMLRLKDFNYSNVFETSPPFTIIQSNQSKLGQNVFTLGFPLGDILGKSAKLSTGTLNSLYGLKDDPRLFQISTPIQPGNSGGALFNNNGEIVGIVVASLNAKYFYENADIIPQNVNFAVKSDYVLNLISMLPEEQSIKKRQNRLIGLKLEKQIKEISPFIVTIKVK